MGTPRVRWHTPAAGALLERKEDQGMKTRSFNLSQDQIDDLVKICEVAKEQAEWKLTCLCRFFDEGERRSHQKTVENFIAACEVYKDMFRGER